MRRDCTVDNPQENAKPACRPRHGDSTWSPWPGHDRQILNTLQGAGSVDQKSLTNIINRITFKGGYLLACLRHPKYGEEIVVKAHPEPCQGKELFCRWSNGDGSYLNPEGYRFRHVIIDDGRNMLLVPGALRGMDGEGFTIQLPERGFTVAQRRNRRYPSQGVMAELIQSGFSARGILLDFSPAGFRIRVEPDSNCSFSWFNPEVPATISLRSDERIIFSGLCKCVRLGNGPGARELVVTPENKKISRFKKTRLRNYRQHLAPAPTLLFDHPLVNKRVRLPVFDISTTGFCVYEDPEQGTLIPGMIIPELTIRFSGSLKFSCLAQVIYRSEDGEGEKNGKRARCGLSILEMDMNSYTSMAHILINMLDPCAHVSDELDVEELWDLFFDSGFIYPEKYDLMHPHREDFKKLFRKLYQECPEIAKHFTYQREGRISGHISMIRAYERAWIIHHHAAKKDRDNRLTGLKVLKELMQYLNNIHRLPSANLDYVFCYFRPESRVPDRIFGGFERSTKNQGFCSTDLFSYLPVKTLPGKAAGLPAGWSLGRCSDADLWEFRRFYSYCSGGLLLDVLDLDRFGSMADSIENVYARLGLLRRLGAYSLEEAGVLRAVMLMEQSDLGLNLSELLNAIKVFVIDPKGLPWDTLATAIVQLAALHENNVRVPVLIYPSEYVKENRISSERQYQLWILKVCHGNVFIDYLQRKFRIAYG